MSAGLAPSRVFAHGFIKRQGREDEQIGGQCRRPDRAGLRVRCRSGALFPVARDPLRAGRQLSSEGASPPHQIPTWPTSWATWRSVSLSMVAKNLDGMVPAPETYAGADDELLALADGLLERCVLRSIRRAIRWTGSDLADAGAAETGTSPRPSRGCCLKSPAPEDQARQTVLYATRWRSCGSRHC